jgi:uncharacterized protein YeaO (DUF488 family)
LNVIRVKRVYDPPEPNDGSRVLVDHLWPRGVKKEDLHASAWLKQVAPSDPLRKWFGHERSKWDDFQRRYFRELNAKPAVWQPLLEAAKRGNLSLLFSARDTEHNNAVALKAFLEKRLGLKSSAKRRRVFDN